MSAPVQFRWLVGSPGFLGQQCGSGYYWDGTKCVRSAGFIICAARFDNIGGKCVRRAAPPPPPPAPAGSVQLLNGRVYRFRLLVGYDPSKNTCVQVRDFLNAAIKQGETNPN